MKNKNYIQLKFHSLSRMILIKISNIRLYNKISNAKSYGYYN